MRSRENGASDTVPLRVQEQGGISMFAPRYCIATQQLSLGPMSWGRRYINVARRTCRPESGIIFQYRNTHLRFFDGTVGYLCCVPQKEELPGRTGPDRNCRFNHHDCKYSQKEQSEIDVLTNTKGLISAGMMCSVVQARSGLGYAVSFSSDAQRRAFQKVPRLD